MPDDGDDMITTTHEGESIVSFRISPEFLEFVVQFALGLMLVLVALTVMEMMRHG